MRLPHRLQGQKVKSQGGAGAYCGGDLAAQLVFIFILHFLFVPCGRLSWLSVSFLLHVKYTLSYRIVLLSNPGERETKKPRQKRNTLEVMNLAS